MIQNNIRTFFPSESELTWRGFLFHHFFVSVGLSAGSILLYPIDLERWLQL